MRLFLGSLFALATLLVNQSSSSAQSWLGDPNSLSASFSHTYSNADTIVETEGQEFDGYDLTHMVSTLAVDYVTPIDKLSVTVNIPIVMTNYGDTSQPNPHVNPEWDDGDTHVALQDLGISANYQLFGNYTGAVIGSLGVGIPMSDYPVVGFDAPGRGLKEANIALQGSISFEEWVPGLYGMAGYKFSLVEKADQTPELEDYSQNKSAIMALVGYYITDELEVNLNTDIQLWHDGINFVDFGTLSQNEQDFHDVILNERIYLAGLGVSYAFTDKLTGRVFYSQWLAGQNTSNASVGGLAIDWAVL